MRPPAPHAPLPPARLVQIPGRGEFFLRDSGGDGPPVLLLHGWMFAADLNWLFSYEPLRQAGYRVLAVDHRGHGRGLRMPEPFRLVDCAADAAAIVRAIDCGPVVATGYSMGGPIAQIMARDHPDTVASLVLCATATDWRDVHLRLFWRTMAFLRLGLGLFPTRYWEWMLGAGGMRGDRRAWTAAELSRGSTVDLAEAGRELSRYDARPWIASLRTFRSAVVLTKRDLQVRPRKQRALAKALGAEIFEVPKGDHMVAGNHPDRFNPALLRALARVTRARSREAMAAAG